MKRVIYTLLLGSLIGLVVSASVMAQDTISMQNGSAQGCNFIFYASGGANGQYAANEQLLYTFTANEGQYPHLHFTSFDMQAGDTLIIYDGDEATNTPMRLIGKFGNAQVGAAEYANGTWGQAPPPDLYATSGSFTFRFKSNSSGQGNGWAASITCVPALNIISPDMPAWLGLHIINPDTACQTNVLTVDSGAVITLNLADFIVPSMTTYDYVVQSIPYNPPFNLWEGIDLGMNVDDKWGPPTELPFTFEFFGLPYDTACPGANGTVSLNYHANGSYFPFSYSNTNNIADNGPTPANSIFGVLEDLYPGQFYPAQGDLPAGNIKCGVVGEYPNRAFVFNFWRVKLYGTASILDNYNSYQIVLFEGTGAVEVHVRHRKCCAITNTQGEGIIGLLNKTGTQFIIPQTPYRGMQNPSWNVLGETDENAREAWRFWAVTPMAGYDVAWFENDTNSQPISTSKSNSITVERNMKLIARLQFTAPGGDFYTILDTLSIFVAGSVEAIANNGIETLKIYPNPANELLYIELGDDFSIEKDLTVQITDLSGKMLFHTTVKKTQMQIDINSYPSGIYIVNLKNRNQQTIRSSRVVKY